MPWNVCEPPSQQEEEAGCEIVGLSLPQGNSGQSMIPDIWPDYKETFQALGSQSSMLTCESLGGSIISFNPDNFMKYKYYCYPHFKAGITKAQQCHKCSMRVRI